MAYVKIVNNAYRDWSAIYNIINYIFRYGNVPPKFVGGYGVIFGDETNYSNDIVEQFEAIKIIYKKQECKLLKHFVITFSEEEKITEEDACSIAWKFIKYFQVDYQVVFAVHNDTDHIHIHVVLNTTNISTGNCYSDFYDIEKLNKFLENIMINHRLHTKKSLVIFIR